MLSEKQKTFTENIGKLIAYAFATGFRLTFGEVYRTIEQQKIYFDSGKSKTMDSRHLQRLAVDFNIFRCVGETDTLLFCVPENYVDDIKRARNLGDYWTSLNPDNVWGGDWNRNDILDETFKDPYHFEMKPD